MTGYRLVDRDTFVRNRYRRFKLMQEFVLTAKLDPKDYITVDLDSCYGGDKRLKDVVICDMCNEEILDPFIVLFAEERVYHKKCIEGEMPQVDKNVLIFLGKGNGAQI
jgi:hypothetical protein